jgi:hypothetical protein
LAINVTARAQPLAESIEGVLIGDRGLSSEKRGRFRLGRSNRLFR